MKVLFALLFVVLVGFSNVVNAQKAIYEDVLKKRFTEVIRGEGILIDLRTPKEYKAGHIEGSVNIDYFADGFEAEIDKLDKSKAMYIYCASGGRSGLTLKMMKKKGFKEVYHFTEGYDGWIN